MNDEPNQFERRLSRQPLRSVPRDWRTDILAAARAAQTPVHAVRPAPRPWFAAIRQQVSAFFWPHPKAWAGLAAIWVLIFLLHLSVGDEAAPRTVAQSAPPSPEAVVELRQQQKLFAELVGSTEPRAADLRKTYPGHPRTEWGEVSTV